MAQERTQDREPRDRRAGQWFAAHRGLAVRAGPALLVCALALAACVRRASLPEPVSPLAATRRAGFPAAPSVAHAEPVEAPPITTFKLENGLRVMVLERPDLDWVSIRYTARRGAEDGTHAELGAASMVMGLAMLAPQAGGEPVAPVAEPGAPEPGSVIHGYVDRVAGHVVTSSMVDELDATLGELAALIREPRVSTQAVRDVAFRQLDRIDAANFDALELARCHARQILYGDDHPLGQPMEGRLSELGKLTLGQLEEHHRFMFAPEASALIVVGGAPAAQVRELAERHFSALTGGPSVTVGVMAAGEAPERRVRGLLTPGKAALIVQGFPAPAAPSSERVPFRLLSMLAAELIGSRVNQALRERAAQTYHVGGLYELRSSGGTWLLEVRVEPGDLVDALRTIDRELVKLAVQPIEPAELEHARAQFRERRRAQLADAASAADLLDEAFVFAASTAPEHVLAEWQRDYGRIEGITGPEVEGLARQYLDAKQRALVVAGDLGRFRHDLQVWNSEIDLFVPNQMLEKLRRHRGFVADE
jgi:predicted Zn-dependent peptidase